MWSPTPRMQAALKAKVTRPAILFALDHVDGAERIDRRIADNALGELEVDAACLDAMDRRYLLTIAESYAGGPVGVTRSQPPCRSRAMRSRTSSSRS